MGTSLEGPPRTSSPSSPSSTPSFEMGIRASTASQAATSAATASRRSRTRSSRFSACCAPTTASPEARARHAARLAPRSRGSTTAAPLRRHTIAVRTSPSRSALVRRDEDRTRPRHDPEHRASTWLHGVGPLAEAENDDALARAHRARAAVAIGGSERTHAATSSSSRRRAPAAAERRGPLRPRPRSRPGRARRARLTTHDRRHGHVRAGPWLIGAELRSVPRPGSFAGDRRSARPSSVAPRRSRRRSRSASRRSAPDSSCSKRCAACAEDRLQADA